MREANEPFPKDKHLFGKGGDASVVSNTLKLIITVTALSIQYYYN